MNSIPNKGTVKNTFDIPSKTQLSFGPDDGGYLMLYCIMKEDAICLQYCFNIDMFRETDYVQINIFAKV